MRILNWYAKDPKLVRGLRSLYDPKTKLHRHFVTMRYGAKWANRLKPGDVLKISISDDPFEPNTLESKVIGKARVYKVTKTAVGSLAFPGFESELSKNIGAKTCRGVIKALKKIYGKADLNETLSIIELIVCF